MIGASAVINLPNQILLFSDGIEIDHERYKPGANPPEWEVTSEENAKVHQINPHVGVIWRGDGVDIVPQIQEVAGPGDDVKHVANLISEELLSYNFDTDFPDVTVVVVGYDQDGEYWGLNIDSVSGFEAEHNKLTPQQAHFQFPGLSHEDIKPKMLEFYDTDKPPVVGAMNLFGRLLTYYKEEGLPVGGTIFAVRLLPPDRLLKNAVRKN